jgi:hypothetical protein
MPVLLVRYSIQDAFSVQRSYPKTIIVVEIPVKPIKPGANHDTTTISELAVRKIVLDKRGELLQEMNHA